MTEPELGSNKVIVGGSMRLTEFAWIDNATSALIKEDWIGPLWTNSIIVMDSLAFKKNKTKFRP
jgi:hypothetical protein